MNLNHMMSMAERLTDQQLAALMRGGSVLPEFVAASELQRRKGMREAAQTAPPTVAETLAAEAEPPETYAEGGYVGTPAGYRAGFDPEYDAWRRSQRYNFVNYPLTPQPGADAASAAAAEAARRAAQQQGGAGEGLGALALSAGLGLLPKLPSIYRGVRDLFGSEEAAATTGDAFREFPDDPTPLSDGIYGGADFYGADDLPLPPEFLTEAEAAALFDLPGSDIATVDGFEAMGVSPDEFVSVSSPAGGVVGAVDDPLYGTLGETPIVGGDFATTLGGLGGGALGSLISAQAFANSRRPYASLGQQAGSALGGVGAGAAMGALYGSALGPIGTAFGALGGAVAGGMAGGAAGSAMGPEPTVGRNFGVIGTVGGDGRIHWGGAGGDNGGTEADARAFGDWLGGTIQQRAAERGLAFNPNMEGVQFQVGGYDNPSRRGEAPGGYFYDPYMGGSPENYALRPNPGMEAYSGEQTAAFVDAMMADLVARNVLTAPGQERDRAYYESTRGAPLGYYGHQTYGQQDTATYDQMLAQRQGAVEGWVNDAAIRNAEYEDMIRLRDEMNNTQVYNAN